MTDRPASRPPAPTGLNLSLGDVYHIVFRHKWKILMIAAVGFVGSYLIPVVKKVPYTSEAKLYIPYILESSTPTPDANDPRIKLPDTRGESIINTELEILTSLDLAQQVADAIGPERILGAGNRDRLAAGSMVRKGLAAEVTKNSCVIRLTFQHANREIVQPVLQQLIDLYSKKHTEIHAIGAFDDFLTQETDQLRSDLTKTEHDLGQAKTNLGFYASLEDAKKFQGEEISRIRQSIFDAEAELAECKVAAGDASLSTAGADSATNSPTTANPQKLAEYKRVLNHLDSLYKKEQEDSFVYTPESAWMGALRKQITNNVALKEQLEKQNPELLSTTITELRRIDTTSRPGTELHAQNSRANALRAKISVLNEQLGRLQKEAASVSDAEGAITKLQLQKDIEEGRYRHFVKGLEQARIDEKIGNGKVPNIKPIQQPSPPFRDSSKLQKTRLAVAFAGCAIAIGLAFVLELFVDRTVKHAGEIEGKLGLPLFLTVPIVSQNGGGSKLGWMGKISLLGHRNGDRRETKALPVLTPDNSQEQVTEISPATHDFELPLRPFFDALRDRLIGFFEMKGLTHKPKLVAVTSCRQGAGVSTIASGLAASLSETGDGNVLLVDMNQQNGAPRHFIGGRLNCGIDDALENEKRDSALVQDNLYVVSAEGNGGAVAIRDKMSRILPKRFSNLVPKLKASDYDYIIFDMPTINQLSVTPRLAKFMDMMLIVIESEKTDRDLVKRAITLLAESKPNVGAVLNKRKTYVPRILHEDL